MIQNFTLNPIELVRAEEMFQGMFVSSRQCLDDLLNVRHEFLHPKENNYFESLTAKKRKLSYLLGRYVAKKGIAAFVGEENLTKIEISPGVFHQPVVYYPSKQNLQVSITHSDDWGAAVVFPEAHPMAIDVEVVRPERKFKSFFKLTPQEESVAGSIDREEAEVVAMLWTVKEAMAKVIKTGLMASFDIYEINKIDVGNKYTESYFSHYTQYKSISWFSHGVAWSIVLPKKTKINIDHILQSQSKAWGRWE